MSFLIFDKLQTIEVPAEGPADAKIVIVGEAPGATEERLGRPFVGANGSELDKLLHSAGLIRQTIYLTNVIKERPKNNEIKHFIDLSKKYPVVTDTAKKYLQSLKYELENHPCNVIIALGNTALWALTEKTGITKWRGSILESTLLPGKKVIPTYHPRHVLPPTGIYTDRNVIIHDLLKAKEQQDFPEIRDLEFQIGTSPTFDEAIHFLNVISILRSEVDVDIEVCRYEVSCIGFTFDSRIAMCIPFVDEHGDYWNIEQEAEIWKLIAKILENPAIKKRGQNFIFDSYFLLRKHGIRSTNIEDTMIAQGICYPDYPKGLDFITSMYTDMPYYKDEGKKWNKIKDGWPQMWHYNAKDVLATANAWSSLARELKVQKNEETYKRQVSLVEPLCFMQHRGVLMDIDGISRAKESVSHAIENLTESFYKACGREINPNSPAQLKEYFYSKETGLGLVPYLNRKTHQPSVDADALKRISRKGYDSAKILLELRRLTKLRGTYLEITLDPDSRLRCSFNPVGTSSGRLSSSKTIFDTGTNLQNQPYEMRQFMLFDERYIGYNIDLSQAENRLVAYVGNVYEMIQAFESGIDVHKLTASLIFSKPIEQISADERQWGKRGNHCHYKDTEVYTPKGWMCIEKAMQINCPIAQWDSGIISFVQPESWFTDKYSGLAYVFTGTFFSQRVTPEHRMLYTGRNGVLVAEQTAEKFTKSSAKEFITAGTFDGSIELPSEFIRLLAAFQADGGWNGSGPKWKLKNKNKIRRLLQILDILGEDYYYHEYINSEEYSTISLPANSSYSRILKLLFPPGSKIWPQDTLNLTLEGLQVLASEILLWDGDGQSYWTSIPENVEIIQTLFHLVGWKANIGWACKATGTYRIGVSRKRGTRTDVVDITTEVVQDEDIFCPTVPSGAFMIKHRGKISVSGNSLNYDLGYKSFAIIYEVEEKFAKYVVDRYHQAYPGVRQSYHQQVKDMLSRNRTVTNCLGRNRVYLDRWGDTLFKEAYSFIPQSTVADIMNERGINYIYYSNDPDIKPVELLIQVHDSIVIQIPRSIPIEQHVVALMKIKQSLETPISWRARTFSIPADIQVSFRHMGKGEGGLIELPKGTCNSYDTFLAKLQELCSKN